MPVLLRNRLTVRARDFIAAIGVAAGCVGAGNFGTHQRNEFTVIGNAVNKAARLCELAENDLQRLVTSEATAAGELAEARHWRVSHAVRRVTSTRLGLPEPDQPVGLHNRIRTLYPILDIYTEPDRCSESDSNTGE
ncbi:hypothetical protein ACWEO2_35670 [Nocardia sp. NPDC004278]